ncbi:MAG: thiamine-phosphate kinase [Candidatus Omnitrophica bacterium]|nr:thiamine-phosphate kinase [Candidatus Omnitrophota bacterium]
MSANINNKISELGLIDYFGKIFKSRNPLVLKGIGDDAAAIKISKNKYLLSTCDMLIEGKHFRKSDNLYDVGYKSIACSLSDIAAMGGEPKFALLSLGIPKRLKLKGVSLLLKGIKKAANKFSVDIIGGDTNASDKLIIDVSMLGFSDKKRLVLRSNAKVGDYIFVTGKLGGSIYARHLNFMPRVKEAKYLVSNFKLNSMIDISDGLALDLWRILKESNAGAVIFENLLPRHKHAKNIGEVLYMGEDFELLFTMEKAQGEKLLYKIRNDKIDFPLSFIGKIIKDNARIYLANRSNQLSKLEPKGFLHF